MDLKIKKYEVFICACECKSVSQTAKIFGNSQSGITQLLNSLEDELGLKLLVRNKNGVRMTNEGHLMYNAIKKVVEANRSVKDLADRLKMDGENILRIGAFKSIAVNWLPIIIKEFGEENPLAEFEIFDGGYFEIEEKLRSKELDVGFVSMPFDEDCPCRMLMRDSLLAVIPQNHRLAGQRCVSAREFERESVVSLVDNTDRDARIYLEKNGIVPNIKYKSADDYAMLSMVENELGICIAHQLVLKNGNHRVLTKPLNPEAFRTIGLALPQNENRKPLVNKFADFVEAWVKKEVI